MVPSSAGITGGRRKRHTAGDRGRWHRTAPSRGIGHFSARGLGTISELSNIHPGLPVRDADLDDHISVQSTSSNEQELDFPTSRGPPSEPQLGAPNEEQGNHSFSSASTAPFPEAATAGGSAPRVPLYDGGAQAPSQDPMAAMLQLLQASVAQQLRTFADEQATTRAQS